MIGVESYGYFQLYMLYITFLGIFHLGWVDGMYLKLGGKSYDSLDSKLFSGQFKIFMLTEFIISLFSCVLFVVICESTDKMLVLLAASVCMLLYNSNIFIQFILLATNQIKQYASIIILDRLLYLVFVLLFLLFKGNSYKGLLIADLLSRMISLLYAILKNKRLLVSDSYKLSTNFTEIKENILIGYKVTFGGIAGIFITGIIRFMMEGKWGIVFFGKISLALTLSNLMMVFVNAVSMVVFPILKKVQTEDLSFYYRKMRDILMISVFTLMIFYYPVKYVLSIWLPIYSESLHYMSLMFPIIIFNSKTAMLINTYLKVTRKESIILISNLFSLLISIIIGYVSIFIISSPNLAVLSIVASLAIRSILAEKQLCDHLNINITKDTILEISVTVFFMVINWYIKSAISILLYGVVLVIYFVLKRKDIKSTFVFVSKKSK
ncbi:hypothetical protein RU98_GL001073 [Enterococcus caccae]|nr:hypothetical protein RU98_GL001073 [Enterococcus caccae]